MLEFLKGKVVRKGEKFIVVECGYFGIKVFTTLKLAK